MNAPYVGQQDFRGYLSYLGQNGDQSATDALNYTGNDGGIGTNSFESFYDSPMTDRSADRLAGQQYVTSAYKTYNGGNIASAPSAPAVNQNAGLISSLNSQIGQLDPQQQVGIDNINQSYGRSSSRLAGQRNLAEQNYNTGVQQNNKSYASNRSGIYGNVNAQSNALQRLLGMNGSGNSSAAYEQAPYAAALQGSQQLSQAQQAFGNNQTSLDSNWQNTERSYKNSKDDLDNQKYQQGNALRSSISQTRASLLDRLQQAQGTTAQQPEINDLLSQITQLGRQYENPNISTGDISTAAPTLQNYFLNSNRQGAAQAQGGAASELNPSFLGLLGQKRDAYGNIIQ